MRATTAALRGILGDAFLVVYLHGSAVSGKLRPQSDIDLLAVIDRGITNDQRNDLLTALMRISGRHPAAPGGPRCIEVIIFCLSDLSENRFPTRAEFTYDDWLRDAFEAGELPMPTRGPEYTLVLAQASQHAILLLGQCASDLLPEISLGRVRQAMYDALPALLHGLLAKGRAERLAHTCQNVAYRQDGRVRHQGRSRCLGNPANARSVCRDTRLCAQGLFGENIDEWGSRCNDAKILAGHLRERVIELL